MAMYTMNDIEERYKSGSERIIVNGSDTRAFVTINLDVSGSVSAYQESITRAAKDCIEDLKEDDITRGNAIIQLTFFGTKNGISTIGPKPVCEIAHPEIDMALADCGYLTPGDEALAISRENRKAILHEWISNNLDYVRPLEILISDLHFKTRSNGGLERLVHDCEEHKINLITIVTPGYYTPNAKTLDQNGILLELDQLNEDRFRKLFQWIPASVKVLSQSTKGHSFDLPNPEQYGMKPLRLMA